jgi:cytochrome c
MGLLQALAAVLSLLAGAAAADGFRVLEGHGGPIMGVASADGVVATASFDNSVGLWKGDDGPPRWLEAHEAAVKSVIFAGDKYVISGGDDNVAIIWDRNAGALIHRLERHEAKIMSVRASPDGAMIATASWDRRIGIWDVATGLLIRWLKGHTSNVNDIAFTSDGKLISASYDGTIREWRIADGVQTRIMARHGFGVNTLLVDEAADWLAYGALDGGTRVLRLSDGAEIADLTLDRRPILSMARRADGGQIAVGDGEGYIMVVGTANWTIQHDFRAAKRGPVWALAYVDGGTGLLAGGIEDDAYVWPVGQTDALPRMGEDQRIFHTDPARVSNGERQFLRKCSVCHTLNPGSSRKAGPSLYGLFGRQAGTYPGYTYSDALNGSDLIWSEDAVDKLFDLGPDFYTPGSKMPMQQIAKPQDRADLIAFLKTATAAE